MKYLNKILEVNEIAPERREAAAASYLAAKERVRSLPLTFSDDAEMVLSNHLMALIKRIGEGQLIDPMDDETLAELSEPAWRYAGEVAGALFTEAGLPEDKSEIFLVGTHMEMALANQ